MNERRIGRYEIVGLLGSGGIGQVYAAQDPALGRAVAIKALRAEHSGDPSVLERFHVEAASLARLSHPNVATLYDLYNDAQQLFMIMELVRGHTLEAVLARHGKLGARDAVAIAVQAIAGLGYAHQMGVIHRDVKPSNLMLTETGTLKIMDFGIARVRGTHRMTRTGSLVGTLAYVAPEQIKGSEGDERSDIYSLGCVFYEMLAGAPPFTADTEYELIRAHVEAQPAPIKSRVEDLPGRIDAAIVRALAKDPAERFASMQEFSVAIADESVIRHAADIVRDHVLPPIGPISAPKTETAALSREWITEKQQNAAPALPNSGKRAPAKAFDVPLFLKSKRAPFAALGSAVAVLVLAFGYAILSPQQPTAPSAPALIERTRDILATPAPLASAASVPRPLPQSSLILPPPELSYSNPDGSESHESALPNAGSKQVDQSVSSPLPRTDESPAYKGRVTDWPGPNLIVVPFTSAFGLKFLKLFGILDASRGKAQAEQDHRKMQNFLSEAGDEIVCYSRGESTFQCYANNQDIALWAVKNGFAKPTPNAPREYLEARK